MEVSASGSDRRWSTSSISPMPTDGTSFYQERQTLTQNDYDRSHLDDETSQSGVDNEVNNSMAANKTPATTTTVTQNNSSSNDPKSAIKTKSLSKPKKPTLRYRKTSVCLLACYLPLIIIPWTITCVLAKRPLNGTSYYVQWGGLDARGILAIVGWLAFVRILNSIAGVLTIPIVSAIIAQAAVVYAQRRKEQQQLNMRQLFALADKGWSDFTILWGSWGPNRKGTGSRFLWLAFLFISLCAIQQPIQSALVGYEQITVITCLDIPLYGCDKYGFPTTIGWEPEPGDMTLVPQDLVVQEVASKLATVSDMDVQPYLWPDNPNAEKDLIDAFVNPVSRRSFFWYQPGGLAGHGNVSYFATSVENGTTTGVLRQHAMRFNSSAQCAQVARSEFPDLCPGPRSFNTSFRNDYVHIRVCAPGEYGVYPWTLSRSRQDISEEMFLDVSGPGSVELDTFSNFTIHCTANTTRGYFELGNYQNNYTYGGLVDQWPSPEAMEHDWNDYLPESSGWGKPSESDNTSALQDDLPFIFQQSPDQYDTSSLKVSGPLMTSMIAMFGNHSSFHLAANASNTTFPSVLWQIYQRDQTPLTRLSLVEYDNYGALSHFDPGTGPSDDMELAAYLGGWSFVFNDTDFAEYALEAGMFFANRALIEITVRVEGPFQARPIYTSPGLTIIRPVTRPAQVSIVSVLIFVQILGLVWLMWYIYRVPSWSYSLDSVAVARIGRAMGEHDLPPIGVVTEQDLDRLKKVDALIGVAEQEMKTLVAEGQTDAEAGVTDVHNDAQTTASDIECNAETTSWLTPSPNETKLRLGSPGLITKRLGPKKPKIGKSIFRRKRRPA